MPLFDFECQRCGKMFEALVRRGSDGVACECGGRGEMIITKMPLRSYARTPDERPWGTSFISSSEKFLKKRRERNAAKKEEYCASW